MYLCREKNDTTESKLEKGEGLEVCELWILHHKSINQRFENGGKNNF